MKFELENEYPYLFSYTDFWELDETKWNLPINEPFKWNRKVKNDYEI